MGTFFALMAGVIFLVFILIGIVFYVLKSIGLQTLAANRGIENPWLAWIPIGDLYILGLLIGELDVFGYHLDNLGLWVPVIYVVGGTLQTMQGIGFIFWIALVVFSFLLVNRLFEIYTTNAVLYTVLSILLCLFPVLLFVIRNNQPIGLAGGGSSS